MLVTESKLRQIIKEEFEKLTQEAFKGYGRLGKSKKSTYSDSDDEEYEKKYGDPINEPKPKEKNPKQGGGRDYKKGDD